jgi:3-oxoacyl-[acyl-carrier protein] reductase
MIDPQIAGKVALVTGTNNPQGIGAATARALAAQGVRVFGVYTGTPSGAEVAGRVRSAGGDMAVGELDITEPGAAATAFDAAEQAFGPVDILVNNACSSGEDTFLPVAAEQRDWAGRALATIDAGTFARHFLINSRAPALLIAELARRHIDRGASWGRIVNVSTDGAAGFPGEISYWASKAALESYSRAAARELAPHGITVNIVSPGPVQTGWIPDDQVARMDADIPLGRVGRPEDIADAIIFLVSEQAQWITGQLLRINGGHRMS